MLHVLKENLLSARIEYEKAEKEYESLKNEVLKALQGESAFQMTVLSELVEATRVKMQQADEKVRAMNKEAEAGKLKTEAIRNEYKRILQWSEMFDSSDMETKKMIAGYIIKRVEVYENYRLHLEFNMSIEQFNLGLDIPSEYNMQSIAV